MGARNPPFTWFSEGLDETRSVKLGFLEIFFTVGFSMEFFFEFLAFSTEDMEEVEEEEFFLGSSFSFEFSGFLGLEEGGADLTSLLHVPGFLVDGATRP